LIPVFQEIPSVGDESQQHLYHIACRSQLGNMICARGGNTVCIFADDNASRHLYCPELRAQLRDNLFHVSSYCRNRDHLSHGTAGPERDIRDRGEGVPLHSGDDTRKVSQHMEGH
jgi:hypothetical protein